MTFVGRQDELAALRREYETPGFRMMVLYGRRRLGKTTLCRRFMEGKDALYFLATEENEAQNLNTFASLSAALISDPFLEQALVHSWEILFRMLRPDASSRKRIIVIDEFQYLVKANPAFLSILQRICDEILRDSNILLILCGSLVHMMRKEMLNYSSPLYGRRTSQLPLRPFSFRDFASLYPGASERDLCALYSIAGGVPKYAEILQPRRNIIEMISDHVLNTSGFLYEEPFFPLRGEVAEVGSYFSIVRAIAAGNEKLGHIGSISGMPATRISPYLATLRELEIIRREVPATELNPEKSKNGLYRIEDHFFRFWFRYIYPNRSYVESGHIDRVRSLIERNLTDGHVSFIYEDICREQMWELSAAGAWPFAFANVGRWWNRNTEIDIVATGADGCGIVFGECKYRSAPVDETVLHELERKAQRVQWGGPGRREYYVLFSISGFTPGLVEAARGRSDLLLAPPYAV